MVAVHHSGMAPEPMIAIFGPTMLTVAIVLLVAIGLRIGLHAAAYTVPPFEFWTIHLLALVLLAYLAGYRELRDDRNSSMNDLIRISLRDVVLYAVVIAVFSWVFYTWLDTSSFPARNALLIEGFVNDGIPRAEAEARVGNVLSPANYAGISFLALMITGSLSALIMSLVHHRVLRRFMR